MPTYRRDLHTGHEVPLVETDDIMYYAVTSEKIADEAVTEEKLAPGAVTRDKLAPEAISDLSALEAEVLRRLDEAGKDVIVATVEECREAAGEIVFSNNN